MKILLIQFLYSMRMLSPTKATQSHTVDILASNQCKDTLNEGARFTFPSVSVPWVWIRDHCRSEKMYDYENNQRKVGLLDSIDNSVGVKNVSVSHDNGTFEIVWKDNHKTSDTIHSTMNILQPHRRTKILWDKEKLEKLPYAVVKQTELNRDFSKKKIFESLSKYGLAMITEVEVNYEKTVETIHTLAPFMRTTPFGDHELINAEMGQAKSDFGYSTRGLEAHTDGTYFSEPPGLITFHCLQAAVEGGHTLLVDGFHAANQLKTKHSQHYHTLTHFPMPYQYIHSNTNLSYHYHEADYVVKEEPVTSSVQQVRYAMPHRAPLNTVPLNKLEDFYSALETLTRIIEDPSNEVWIKLEPGTVLVLDNWRILHGRSSFSGKRSLFSSYVGRSDLKSVAKVLGVDF